MAWERLAHVELSSAGDTIDSGTIVAKKNLKVIVSIKGGDGDNDGVMRFNSDSGNNYASRWSDNGAADSTQTSNPKGLVCPDSNSNDKYAVVYITNVSNKEKLAIVESISNATGAGNAPNRREVNFKWANTSSQITSIQIINGQSGNFAAGSYITVLGAKEPATADSITVDGGEDNTVTYTGDMSTGWTTGNAGSGFTLDGTNDEIDFLNNYSNDNVAIDLDSLVSGSISTSKWVIRFAIEMSGTASGDNIIWWNGVSSDASVQANSTAQSFIGSGNQTINGTTGTRTYLNMCNNDRLDQSTVQTRLQSGGSNVSDFTGKHYFEIIRDGSNFTVNQYSDAYSTLYGSKTNAVSNEGGGTLRYFISANYQQGSNVTGTLTEFKFYDGVSSVRKGFTAKKNLVIQYKGIRSGDMIARLRFNNDSGNNYAQRLSDNGGTDGTNTSQSGLEIATSSSNNEFSTIYVVNESSKEKLVVAEIIGANTAGAGNAPRRRELSGKWANTSNAITRVDFVNTSTGDFAEGSEVIVWGSDGASDTTYPTLVGGYIFEETDTGKHYIYDGSSTWTEIA